MDLSWLLKAAVPFSIPIIFALFSRVAPAPKRKHWDYKHRQKAEPLPYGVANGFMILLGIAFASTFFLFQWANSAWAAADGPNMLHITAPWICWCFFPFFAALAVPWPFTIWLLRRLGRNDEADEANYNSSGKVGADSYIIMKWMALGIALPIGIFTLFAIPIHFSIGDREARVGHYGTLTEDIYPLQQAMRARIVTATAYNSKSKPYQTTDLLIDFPDGRTLRANQVGDGGSSADPKVMALLLQKTGLTPEYIDQTAETVPH